LNGMWSLQAARENRRGIRFRRNGFEQRLWI
jgi:hypothetical protein